MVELSELLVLGVQTNVNVKDKTVDYVKKIITTVLSFLEWSVKNDQLEV